jgi:hypothetical protein
MATATSKELFAGDTNDPRVLALRAYIWGHAPLLAARLREQLTKPDDPFATRPPTSPGAALNHLGHQRELSDPSLPGVAPNVDTLYSLAWVDLAEEPFVLEAPDFGSRYYTFQFGFADTATELSLGGRTHGARLPAILITGPSDSTPVPRDMLHVGSTTRHLLIAGRVLVQPSDPDDFAAVYDLQSRIKLRSLSRYLAGEDASDRVPEQRRLGEGADSVADEFRTLVELGNLLRDWVVGAPERGLIESFAGIGLSCQGFDPSSLSVSAADEVARGLAEGKALVEGKTYDLGRHVNGWTINYHGPSFGDDYLLRAAVAEDLVYVTVPEEALYPVAKTDTGGAQLTGANTYRLVFAPDAPPPVDAFWSVTMYRRDPYPLVPNALNRYSVGDRTPSLVREQDGALTIRISHEPPPAEEDSSNWLPAPKGPFHLMMRLYAPRAEVLDGSWVPPPVEQDHVRRALPG